MIPISKIDGYSSEYANYPSASYLPLSSQDEVHVLNILPNLTMIMGSTKYIQIQG